MKTLHLLILSAFAAHAFAQDDAPDPTRASPRMKAALMSGGVIPEMTVKGLVFSAARQGAVVMLETVGGARVLVRPGQSFTVVVDSEARKLVVKRIDETGIEIEAPEQKESIVLGGVGVLTNQRGGLPGEVDYAEFRDLPLLDALRMLSDQTGQNFSASVEANKIAVNVQLRDVSAASVVEEICKSHGLWFKRDATSGITRIMTVAEFQKDLVGFREEQTEVFTLKFPNVPEVANAIADLFGDRVRLSLGAEEMDEDALQDLEGRFDRFETLIERTQNAASFDNNVVGGNVSGFISNGGNTSGFGGGNDGSRSGSSTRERLERRRQERASEAAAAALADETSARNLSPAQLEKVIVAAAEGRLAATAGGGVQPTPIYVAANRRANRVVVRTADARAMDDIRRLVTRLDVQTPLVLLEVKVLSIELGKGFESAFEYAITDGTFGGSFSTGVLNPSVVRDPISNAPTGVIATPGLGSTGLRDGQFVFQYLGDTLRARIQLLASKNRVKTLATPTLLTANNEISRLFLGEERPLVRGISSQTIITDNNVATTPNTQTVFRNVGNTLLITPNINSDRTVTLRLVQENSFISPNAANIPVVTTENDDRDNNGILPGNGNNNRNNQTGVRQVPVDVVGTRSVSGTFVAKDGLAVAIGGLIEEVDSDRKQGIPILGDIPGLGILFRRQSKEKSRRELVIILRPYVMSTPADGERISRDMLDRLAPESMELLLNEGFLPEMPPVPPALPVKRPPLSAAASKKASPVVTTTTTVKTKISKPSQPEKNFRGR